jgi:hypothetical protein
VFITQGPVDPASPLFTGREAELDRVAEWLSYVRCVGAIMGARQTGKTSLLYQIRHRFQDRYRFVFVNMEGVVGATDEECYEFLAQEITDQVFDDVVETPQGAPRTDRGFLGFLRTTARQCRAVRVVVLLDEVASLPEQTVFKLAHSIRAVFTNRFARPELGRYVFIIAGASDMLEIATGKGSPLKNVTETLYLTDLEPAQTDQLVRVGLAEHGIEASPELCQLVRDWTHGHPYLTQLVGSLLAACGAPDVGAVHRAIEQVLQEEDRNLPHVRRQLDSGRGSLWPSLRAVLEGRDLPFSRSHLTIAELELVGVIRNEAGWCRFRNRLYQEAITRWLSESIDAEAIAARQALEQRKRDLADGIEQDLALLKKYEDRARYEDDPRQLLRYEREIARLCASLAARQQEIKTVRRRLADFEQRPR